MNNLLNDYAKLIVKKGVNVQKDQLVVVNCPVEAYPLVRLIVKEAYLAGAKDVILNWNDQESAKERLLHASDEVLGNLYEWVITRSNYLVDNKACFISITSPLIGVNAAVDPKKMALSSRVASQKLIKQRQYLMANHGQWCVVGYPNTNWAKKVFPNLSEEEANFKLMDAILEASRVKGDYLQNWEIHNNNLAKYNKILNEYDFDSLIIKNSLGTDIVIGLADDHVWAGGCDVTSSNVVFNPNLPTEENFTMPHKYRVDGKVVASMPLDYQGKLVEDFYLVFKDGKVVDFDAKKEKGALESLLNFDEGSSRIGEIALIPYDSPISKSKILFFNTLYDENASCHMALGAAYPTNIKDGEKLSQAELEKKGYNYSTTHVDFMFGTPDLEITGKKKDGTLVPIFKNGNYCF